MWKLHLSSSRRSMHTQWIYFFVQSTNFTNKRTIRSTTKSIAADTMNVFNYLIIKRNRFFVFTIFTKSARKIFETNFVFVSTSTIASTTSFIFIFTTTISIIIFKSIDINEIIVNFTRYDNNFLISQKIIIKKIIRNFEFFDFWNKHFLQRIWIIFSTINQLNIDNDDDEFKNK